jgi:short-subunit dehydrogenase
MHRLTSVAPSTFQGCCDDGLRAQLARGGVTVHGVFPSPVDTDMSRDFDVPKVSPESVARAIFDGIESGEEDIFPDLVSASVAESWRNGATKALAAVVQ